MLIAVLGLALYPNLRLPELPPSGEYTDFIYHMIAFLSLTASATIAIERNLTVAASMAALAIALEFLQIFVPGRGVFLIDVVASLLGVLLGTLFAAVIPLWRRWSDAPWRIGS